MGVVDTISAAAGQWAWYVCHVTWQASAVAALVVLVAWLTRRRSVRLIYGLGILALIKFSVSPTFSLPTGLFSRVAPAVEVPAAAGPSSSWLTWLMGIYLIGAVTVAALVVLQLLYVRRLTRRATPIRSGPVHRHLSYVARKIGLRRTVRLLACAEGTSPMACGVLSPAVIVPASMLQDLPPRQVATVLAHELAHHRRGDLWINWLQIVLTVVWWFNPLIWLLNRTLRKMREDCCDDLLLREDLTTDDGYCETLLRVASHMSHRRLLGGMPRFAERLHPLGQRIVRIMDPDLRRRSVLSLARVPALVLLALVVLPGLRVHSFLMPPAPGGSNRSVLTSRDRRDAATLAALSRRPTYRRREVRGGDADRAPLVLSGLRRGAGRRLASPSRRALPGDVTVAGRSIRLSHTSTVTEVMTARGTLAVGIERGDPLPRMAGVDSARPAAIGSWLVSRGGRSAVTAGAIDLIDGIAAARDEPVASDAAAQPSVPAMTADDVAIAAAATDPVSAIVEPEGVAAVVVAMPDDASPFPDYTPVNSVQIDPADVIAWTGGADESTGDEDWGTVAPTTPEPTTVTLLALGAALALRRRRW